MFKTFWFSVVCTTEIFWIAMQSSSEPHIFVTVNPADLPIKEKQVMGFEWKKLLHMVFDIFSNSTTPWEPRKNHAQEQAYLYFL